MNGGMRHIQVDAPSGGGEGDYTDNSSQDGRTSGDPPLFKQEPEVLVEEWLSINVGGSMFLTKRSTLQQHPNSLLAELNEDCPFYHPPSGQYLFDRNPDIFQYILDYYRTDQLHFPHNLCGPTIKKELEYWGIEEKNIATCCWNHYKEFSEQEETLVKLGSAFNTVEHFKEKKRNFLMGQIHKWRARIWYFLEDPKSSVGAQVCTYYVKAVLCTAGACVVTLYNRCHGGFYGTKVTFSLLKSCLFTDEGGALAIFR